MTNVLTIISCGKAKKKVPKCLAYEAYIGISFKLKKQYAEQHLPYMILSAKYGLLAPETEIDPNYNKTIQTEKDLFELTELLYTQMGKSRMSTTALITGIDDTFRLYLMGLERIDVLAPKNYVTALSNALARCNIDVNINHLTKGLSQGFQMQFLSRLNKNDNKKESSDSSNSNEWL